MIIWISGPYGVGKSTLAEAMADKMKNALIFDAEEVGNAVRESYPDCPYCYIFEDYPLWGEFCYLLLKDVHEKYVLITYYNNWRRPGEIQVVILPMVKN